MTEQQICRQPGCSLEFGHEGEHLMTEQQTPSVAEKVKRIRRWWRHLWKRPTIRVTIRSTTWDPSRMDEHDGI
jgi:hypothetical protein